MSGRRFEVGRPGHEFSRGQNSEESCERQYDPVDNAKDCFPPRREAFEADAAKAAVGGLREEWQEQAGNENPADYEESYREQRVECRQRNVPAK
jgi:hypothetical protein